MVRTQPVWHFDTLSQEPMKREGNLGKETTIEYVPKVVTNTFKDLQQSLKAPQTKLTPMHTP